MPIGDLNSKIPLAQYLSERYFAFQITQKVSLLIVGASDPAQQRDNHHEDDGWQQLHDEIPAVKSNGWNVKHGGRHIHTHIYACMDTHAHTLFLIKRANSCIAPQCLWMELDLWRVGPLKFILNIEILHFVEWLTKAETHCQTRNHAHALTSWKPCMQAATQQTSLKSSSHTNTCTLPERRDRKAAENVLLTSFGDV